MNDVSTYPPDQVGLNSHFILSIHRYQMDDCSRVVLTFGSDDEDYEAGLFAETSPPVTGEGLAVHTITFETLIGSSGVSEASDGSGLYAFYVNDFEQAARVAIHNNQNRLGRISWLPGQIVIDSISAPTGTGLDLGPVFPDVGTNGAIIFSNAFNPDLNGTAPYSFDMAGYGRPFEADFGAYVTKDGEMIDASFAVTNLFTNETTDYGPGEVAIVSATNWLTGWGRFAFSFEIPESSGPGLYTLVTAEGAVEGGAEFTFCAGGVPATGCDG
jgi:hypothetical protein